MTINPVEITKNQLQLDVTMEAAEIQDLLKKELKKTAQKAKIKGFRPGKTPVNLIKNMYGTQVYVDVINKNLFDKAQEYLKDNDINTFSNFVINDVNEDYKFNIDKVEDFSASLVFVKEASLEDLDFDYSGKLTYYLPEISQERLDGQIKSIRYNIGGMAESSEPAGEESLISFDAVQLENGEVKEGGHTMTFNYSVSNIQSDDLNKNIIGKKIGETFDINLKDFTDNETTLRNQILKLDSEEQNDTFDYEFRVTISNIQEKVLADMDEEFFTRLDPRGNIKSEEDLIRLLKEDYHAYYRISSNMLFFHEFKEMALTETQLDLTDDFYKKFFTQVSQLDDHALQYHLDEYKEDFKWAWIKDIMDKEYGIQVSRSDVNTALIREINEYFGGANLPENIYQKFLEDAYKDNRHIARKKDEIYMAKLASFLIDEHGIQVVNIPTEEYNEKIEELNKKYEKQAEHHHHDHNHGHEHNDEHKHDGDFEVEEVEAKDADNTSGEEA